jgi:hypothetical protein
MAIAERSSSNSFRFPAFSENLLLAIVALAFLVLHVLAGTLVQRALPGEPADQKEAIVSYGD